MDLEKCKPEILRDMAELVGIPSVTSDREKNREALDWLIQRAKSMGLLAMYAVPGEVAIVANPSEDLLRNIGTIDELAAAVRIADKETVGILAHVDVVPADGEWTVDPFSGESQDGFLWGRGVTDDKGPLLLCLHAMAELERCYGRAGLTRNVIMIIGSREEEAWSDMEAFNRLGLKPDFGFTPDGEFPITNREKGYIDLAIRFKRLDEDRNISMEGGTAANVVPAFAKLSIHGIGDMEFRGAATHTSRPEKGINSIVKLACETDRNKLTKNTGRILDIIENDFGDCFGSGIGMDSGEQHVHGEYFHRNVLSPTILSTHEDHYSLVVNMRTTWGYDRERVSEILKKSAEDWEAEIEIIESMDPIMVSRNSEFLKTLGDVYRSQRSEEEIFELAYGTSYAKAMPNIVSFGPIFPGAEDSCHEVNERMELEQYWQCGTIYFQAIAALAVLHKS